MLDALRAIDRQLHEAAQPLDRHHADLVLAALEQDPFSPAASIARLSGRYRHCATQAAIEAASIVRLACRSRAIAAIQRVESLLQRRIVPARPDHGGTCASAHLLEVWLYVHVPVTFALIAALTAHIVSVFYYW